MTEGKIRESVVSERVSWINDMFAGIARLPLGDFKLFSEDARNSAAAESYLRRALEALMDLGRHILAKGFAIDAADYKSISARLEECGIIDGDTAIKMKTLAGYRNRMVHFYAEISRHELYDICRDEIKDIQTVLNRIIVWLHEHEDMLDRNL